MKSMDWSLALEDAVHDLALLKYFPSAENDRTAVARLLGRIVGENNLVGLRWLVDTMLNRVGEWNGPVELRAVYCTRYRPADGVEADAKYSNGFTAGEMETRAKAPSMTQTEVGDALKRLDLPGDFKKLQ